MKNFSLNLVASLLVNVVLASLFLYKLHNNWFEPTVPKLTFRTSIFDACPKEEGKIYFVGDSHTEGFELNELLQNPDVRNRGIWGDITSDVLKRMDKIIERHPKKIFMMIGVNDICLGVTIKDIETNVEKIIKNTRQALPRTRFYIESILPTNLKIHHSNANTIEKIKELNDRYKLICAKYNVEFINLFPQFIQGDGLKQAYSFDGLHLNGEGYVQLANLLKPYVLN